jgi:hypothetical protein
MSDDGHYSRRSGPRDRQFRVGDAEREAVADILRREHLAGRLDNDEFDERVARCLAAKTYAELDELIGDFAGDEREARQVTGSWGWRPWPVPLVFLPLLVAAVVFSHGRAAWLVVPVFAWFVVRPLFWRGFGWRAFGSRTYSRRCWPYGPSA